MLCEWFVRSGCTLTTFPIPTCTAVSVGYVLEEALLPPCASGGATAARRPCTVILQRHGMPVTVSQVKREIRTARTVATQIAGDITYTVSLGTAIVQSPTHLLPPQPTLECMPSSPKELVAWAMEKLNPPVIPFTRLGGGESAAQHPARQDKSCSRSHPLLCERVTGARQSPDCGEYLPTADAGSS